MSLEKKLEEISKEDWSLKKMKTKVKSVVDEYSIESTKTELKSKSTLRAFPWPSKGRWYKRKGYIEDNIGTKLISRVRAGNYNVGNTYLKMKDCLLCGAEGMNHESHIIVKCKELSSERATTDINRCCNMKLPGDDGHGYETMRHIPSQ